MIWMLIPFGCKGPATHTDAPATETGVPPTVGTGDTGVPGPPLPGEPFPLATGLVLANPILSSHGAHGGGEQGHASGVLLLDDGGMLVAEVRGNSAQVARYDGSGQEVWARPVDAGDNAALSSPTLHRGPYGLWMDVTRSYYLDGPLQHGLTMTELTLDGTLGTTIELRGSGLERTTAGFDSEGRVVFAGSVHNPDEATHALFVDDIETALPQPLGSQFRLVVEVNGTLDSLLTWATPGGNVRLLPLPDGRIVEHGFYASLEPLEIAPGIIVDGDCPEPHPWATTVPSMCDFLLVRDDAGVPLWGGTIGVTVPQLPGPYPPYTPAISMAAAADGGFALGRRGASGSFPDLGGRNAVDSSWSSGTLLARWDASGELDWVLAAGAPDPGVVVAHGARGATAVLFGDSFEPPDDLAVGDILVPMPTGNTPDETYESVVSFAGESDVVVLRTPATYPTPMSYAEKEGVGIRAIALDDGRLVLAGGARGNVTIDDQPVAIPPENGWDAWIGTWTPSGSEAP